jgi:DNA mismatch repair protein MutS
VLEYCTEKRKLGAKTMFATHYHELTVLEREMDGVKNYNISAKKRGDDIIFLRKIVPGGTDDSYGIEVAGLAGVPDSVIKRAKAVLKTLENEGRAGGRVERSVEQFGERSIEHAREQFGERAGERVGEGFGERISESYGEHSGGQASRTPRSKHTDRSSAPDQLSMLDMGASEIAAILSSIDLNTLTPLEALSLLFEMKKKL